MNIKIDFSSIPNKPNIDRKDWINSVGTECYFECEEIKGFVKIEDYDKESRKLTLSYKNKKYKLKTCNFLECKIHKVIGLINGKHKYNIGEDVKGFIILKKYYKDNIENFKNRIYLVKCKECGYKQEITERNLSRSKGCPVCCNQKIVKEINSIWKTDNELVKYFLNEEDSFNVCRNTNAKRKFKCLKCGNIQELNIYDFYKRGFNCKKCGDGISYPEKFMTSFLGQLSIDFEREKSFDWLIVEGSKRRFDFFFKVKGKQYVLETDGGWHKLDNTLSKQTKEHSIYLDKEKDRIAKENGVKVIRVNCETSNKDFITDSIYNTIIPKLFDLSNINWDECENFAIYNSTIEDSSNLWEQGLSTSEISEKMGVCIGTTIERLKKGKKLNMCSYTSEKGRKRGLENKMKNITKKGDME